MSGQLTRLEELCSSIAIPFLCGGKVFKWFVRDRIGAHASEDLFFIRVVSFFWNSDLRIISYSLLFSDNDIPLLKL